MSQSYRQHTESARGDKDPNIPSFCKTHQFTIPKVDPSNKRNVTPLSLSVPQNPTPRHFCKSTILNSPIFLQNGGILVTLRPPSPPFEASKRPGPCQGGSGGGHRVRAMDSSRDKGRGCSWCIKDVLPPRYCKTSSINGALFRAYVLDSHDPCLW